jgi:hypothetical protein
VNMIITKNAVRLLESLLLLSLISTGCSVDLKDSGVPEASKDL